MLNFEAFVNACKMFSGCDDLTFKVYRFEDYDEFICSTRSWIGLSDAFSDVRLLGERLCVDVLNEKGIIGYFEFDSEREIRDYVQCDFCNSVVAEVSK